MRQITIIVQVPESAEPLAIALAAAMKRMASVMDFPPANLFTDPNVLLEYVRSLNVAGVEACDVQEATDSAIDSQSKFPRPAELRTYALLVVKARLAREIGSSSREEPADPAFDWTSPEGRRVREGVLEKLRPELRSTVAALFSGDGKRRGSNLDETEKRNVIARQIGEARRAV